MKTKMRILQVVTNVLYTDEDCPSTRQARQFPSLPGDEKCSASAELFFPRFYVLVGQVFALFSWVIAVIVCAITTMKAL